MKVPMLEEHEWKIMAPLLTNQIENIRAYRAEHSADLKTAAQYAFKPPTDKYFELTGFKETNCGAILAQSILNVVICFAHHEHRSVQIAIVNLRRIDI